MNTTAAASPLKPSWAALVQRLGGGALLSWLGYGMIFTEEWVLKICGVLFLFGSVLVIALTPFLGMPRRGLCPECKWPMETSGRVDHDILCPMCCSYLDAENEMLFPVKETDRVCNEPTYAVPTPWDDLRVVTQQTISLSFQEVVMDSALEKEGNRRIWEPKWPPGCCVCGKTVVRKDLLVTPIIKQLKVLKENIEIVLVDVPYCNEHNNDLSKPNNGVRMTNVIFGDPAHYMRFSLLFRSLSYRNAFLELNPGKYYKES